MAQKTRTPVYFPRMKVRGHRNRAKLAARIVTAGHIPYARPVRTSTGYEFVVLGGPEPGAVSVSYRKVTDGFGRRLAERPTDEPALVKPARIGATSWLFSTPVVADPTQPSIWDLLTGEDSASPRKEEMQNRRWHRRGKDTDREAGVLD